MEKGKTFENGYIASEEFPEYIEHFFYFPRSSDAEMAAEQLRARGWPAKVELGADDRDWLVLATQPARGDEDLDDVFPEMEDLATKFSGTYDGYGRPADDDFTQ
jgi:hypothetical protein